MTADPGNSTKSEPWTVISAIAREVVIGFAQIMLQPSHWVGAIFIAGAFWNSPVIAAFGLLGCLAGVATAHILRFPAREREEGLYGFNGALVGLGSAYFYEPTILIAIFVVAGGMVSTIIMRTMLKSGMKPLTFPFVITAWLTFLALGQLQPMAPSAIPEIEWNILEGIPRGPGQVLFQESLLTGMLFLAAVVIRSPVEGAYALLATCIGFAAGLLMGLPNDAILLGLYGYNAVLCAILFAGSTLRHLFRAGLAIVLSVFVVHLFLMAGLPALTFPFVLSSWTILFFFRNRD